MKCWHTYRLNPSSKFNKIKTTIQTTLLLWLLKTPLRQHNIPKIVFECYASPILKKKKKKVKNTLPYFSKDWSWQTWLQEKGTCLITCEKQERQTDFYTTDITYQKTSALCCGTDLQKEPASWMPNLPVSYHLTPSLVIVTVRDPWYSVTLNLCSQKWFQTAIKIFNRSQINSS